MWCVLYLYVSILLLHYCEKNKVYINEYGFFKRSSNRLIAGISSIQRQEYRPCVLVNMCKNVSRSRRQRCMA